MSEPIYNYNKTLETLQEIADTSKTITRDELMFLMMNRLADDKKEVMRFHQAIVVLREKAEKIGITLGRSSGGNYSVTAGVLKAVGVVQAKPVTKKETSNASMSALEANNQKLFLENENLSNEILLLHRELETMKAREAEYKKIITSFYSLAMA